MPPSNEIQQHQADVNEFQTLLVTIVDRVGNQAAVARALNEDTANISRWIKTTTPTWEKVKTLLSFLKRMIEAPLVAPISSTTTVDGSSGLVLAVNIKQSAPAQTIQEIADLVLRLDTKIAENDSEIKRLALMNRTLGAQKEIAEKTLLGLRAIFSEEEKP